MSTDDQPTRAMSVRSRMRIRTAPSNVSSRPSNSTPRSGSAGTGVPTQFILPLYLRESGSPDLALTLEKHGEWYRAATVLYPDWAYRHARLLSRPNSEWLGGFPMDVVAL